MTKMLGFASLDIVQRTFEKEAEKYRSLSLENFLTVEVSLDNRARQRHLTTEDSAEFGEYSLGFFGKPEEIILARCYLECVEILRGDEVINSEAVMQSAGRLINPLDDTDLPCEIRQLRAWELQRRWWTMNGNHFDLLKLPAELRDGLYCHVFGRTIVPFPSAGSRRYVPASGMSEDFRPNGRMLLLNRQVYAETSRHLSFCAEWLLLNKPVFKRSLTDPWLLHRMKYVCLQIPLFDFLKFFGAEGISPDPHCLALRLRESDLLSLKLILEQAGDPHPWWTLICDECLKCRLVDSAWPLLQGQQSSFFIGGESLLIAELSSARRCFVAWRAQAASFGMTDLSLTAWDKWRSEFAEVSDGGVSIAQDDVAGPTANSTLQPWELTRCEMTQCVHGCRALL